MLQSNIYVCERFATVGRMNEKLKLKELPGKKESYYLFRPFPCTAGRQEALPVFNSYIMNPHPIF